MLCKLEWTDSAIRVHLHQHEEEIIIIRMRSGIATLGMSAIYSPPGFEQAFKDRLLHPNRTPAEAEASRKKHGIVYRDAQR